MTSIVSGLCPFASDLRTEGVVEMKFSRTCVVTLAASMTLASTIALPGAAEAHKFNSVKKQRRHIERRARSQLGVRYRSGGERPRKGFDCSGLTSWAFEGHGAALARTVKRQFRAAHNRTNLRIWRRSRLRTGDLVFFKTTKARVGHVGIYIGRGKFISATSSSGVRVDSVYDPYYWGKRWVGATRHRSTRR
jgi:hypothetical protein